MAKDKNGFVLYKDLLPTIKKLVERDRANKTNYAGELFLHILEYVNDENPVPIDFIIEMAFEPIKQTLKRDLKSRGIGKYHWNWKGGKSNINHSIRNSISMKDWRISVFTRDKYTCQHCKKKGGTLNAHHIKSFARFPELRFDIDNGITLCKQCHINEHKRLRSEG